MESNKTMTYKFVNDYAVIVFTVPGMDDWTEAEWDSAAQDDLESYVTTPEQYSMDDCWDGDNLEGDN